MELRIRSLFQPEVVIRILPGGTSTAILLFLYHPCNTQVYLEHLCFQPRMFSVSVLFLKETL